MGFEHALTVFLLDTHVWLWGLEHQPRRLGHKTVRLLDQWAERDALRVSPISIFEVISLHAAGRIHLSRPAEAWVAAALAVPGTRLAPLTVAAAIDAGSIGVTAIPDPVDRLLIATARQMDATLVTRDRAILDYGTKSSALRIYDAAT